MAIKSRAKCTRTVGMDLSARARSRRDSVQGRQQGAGAAARGRLSNFAPPGAPRPFPCEYVPGTPVRCLGCRVINIGCEYVPENVRKLRLRLTAVCHRAGRCCCSFRTMANCTELRRQSQCKLQASPRDRLSETVTQACTRGRFQRRAGNCPRTR